MERDGIGSEGVRALGVLFAGPALVVGLWLVAFGAITPGGGFQGGVAIAGAFLLVYAVTEYASFHTIANHHVLDVCEATGSTRYGSEAEATRALARIRRRAQSRRAEHGVYRCVACGAWHLTSAKPRPPRTSRA